MNKVIFGLSIILFLAAGNFSNAFANTTQETNKEVSTKEKDKDKKSKKKKKKCCASKEESEEKSCCKKDGEKKSCEGKK